MHGGNDGLKQLTFKTLPLGRMISPLDLEQSREAFQTSWAKATLEAAGCSAGTVGSDTKSSKTAQQVKAPWVKATPGKAVPRPRVFGQWNVLFFPHRPWRPGRERAGHCPADGAEVGEEGSRCYLHSSDTFISTGGRGGGSLDGIVELCFLHELQGKYFDHDVS